MRVNDFPLHHRSEVLLAVEPDRLFVHLDDHRRLVAHMEKPSLMMIGGSMRIEFDEDNGQAVGSTMRMTGSVLGLHLSVDEEVTLREPPTRKMWETRVEPRLLVIGAYRMGFTIMPVVGGSRLAVFIDYDLPSGGLLRLLKHELAAAYAAWCTRRMASDAASAFGLLRGKMPTA